MGVYGYCVVPRDHMAGEVKGIGGAAVTALVISELAVLVSNIDRPDAAVQSITEHNAVVEAAVTQEVTPVPLRFGQWSQNAEAFERVITEKAEWYRERLDRFAGALEFGIRVAAPDRSDPARDVRPEPAVSGLEYMKRLRDSVRGTQQKAEQATQLAARMGEVMRDVVREERVQEARTPHGVITVAHLVSRNNFEQYHQRAAALREMFPELRFLVSGPWVPYSFAT